MPFLEVRDNLEIFYTDEGVGGTPLLFVHVWTCDSHDWAWQLEYVARRARVIAVDHSLGGLIVSALAVDHPDLVEGVVAIDPSYGYAPADAAPMISRAEAMTLEPAVEQAAAVAGFADGPHTPDFFRSWHRRRMLSMPAHVVAESYIRIWTGPEQFGARAQTEAYLDRRICPSLTLYSAGHEDCAAWANARAPAGPDEAMYLPLGHWPHQETPGLFNALIENWTTRLSKTAAATV